MHLLECRPLDGRVIGHFAVLCRGKELKVSQSMGQDSQWDGKKCRHSELIFRDILVFCVSIRPCLYTLMLKKTRYFSQTVCLTISVLNLGRKHSVLVSVY